MSLESLLIVGGLLVVFAATIKWPRVIGSFFGLALLVLGAACLVNESAWRSFLAGGEAKGIAPYVGVAGYVFVGLGLVIAGGFLLAPRSRAIRATGMAMITFVLLAMATLEVLGTGPFIRAMWRAGAAQAMLSPQQMRAYQGTSADNLRALYTAMMLEHDSEGAFPRADSWMDAIEDRITTNDMPLAEARKKFVNPFLATAKPGQFGYAMNSAVAGKYKDDVPLPNTTLLLFESTDTSRNANGEPARLLPRPPRPGGNLGITVSGRLVTVAEDGTITPIEQPSP